MINGSKGPEVRLFWPALWYWGMTYPALPGISAFLKNNGIDAKIEDLNIGFTSHVLSRRYVQSCAARLNRELSSVKRRSDRYNRIIFTLSLAGKIERDIPHALDMLHKGNPKQREWAEKIVNSVFHVVRSTYRSLTLNLKDGMCGIFFKGFSEVENFVAEKKDVNPFYDYIVKTIHGRFDSRERYVFGISLTGISQLVFTYTLARELKKACPRCKVVVGGSYLPIIAAAFKDAGERRHLFKDVDAYIIGSGEKPFLKYIKGISAQDHCPIDGVIYKGGKDHVYHEKEGEPLTSLEFSVPDYSYLKKAHCPLGEPEYAVEVSRGCYWGKCTFCASRYGSNLRYHPVRIGTIISSVKYLKRTVGAKRFFFSSLATTPPILEQISRCLLRSGIKIKWRSWCRMDKGLADRRLRLFKRAGCEALLCAPENFDDKILALMNKGVTCRQNKTILLRLQRHGLLESPNFICGFPGETRKNIVDTVNFAKKHRMNIHFFPFYVPKRSMLAENPKYFGIKLLKTDIIRPKYHFKFLKTDHLDIADRVFGGLEEVYPENIDALMGLFSIDAVLVHFEKRSRKTLNLDRLRMSMSPLLLENYMPVGSKGSYWIFDSTYGRVHELNEASYEFLTLCNGRRNLGRICRLMGSGNDLRAIKPFMKFAKEEGLIIIKR